MSKLIDNNLPEEGVSYLGEQYQLNPYITRSKSHHKSKDKLPGGDRYTKITKWTRRIGIGILCVIFTLLAYQIITFLNIGGAIAAPEPPAQQNAQNDFLSANAPKYDELKYISDTTSGTPSVEDVQVGRVTTSTGEGSSVFACDATAIVKFSNSSINSVSKMRLKYTYNSLLKKWEPGAFTIESTNYSANGAPDANQIQEDALTLMKNYDENSANAMEGCSITRQGDLTKDGGELTFTCTKKGGGSEVSKNVSNWQDWMNNQTNGHYDLVKTMKVRVEWSEVDGWGANVTWLGTVGESISDAEEEEENKDKDEDEEKKNEEEELPGQELTCSSGQTVELRGTLSGNTLTLLEKTRFTIDGNEIITSTVTINRQYNQDKTEGTVGVTGTISTDGSTITVTI